MTVQMPEPIPLEMPPGDPGAMADLASDIAAARRRLAAIEARISDSADAAPGWLGRDASAAAGQLVRIDALVRGAGDAVGRAADRLAQHADRLLETRRGVRALAHEQEEEFAEAWRRWGSLPDLQRQVMIAAPAARAIVDELEARERSRRRRHTALLEDIEDDAAATARVLVDSCATVGGRGRPGETQFVVAYLAAQLPGWGDRELIRRARLLAGRLTAGTSQEKARAAGAAVAFAGSTPFATALLAALGVGGVASVLLDLGSDQFGSGSSVARTLAAAFGAAVPGVGADDPVARVLDAEYVHPADDFSRAGKVATGLATVLAAGGALPSGGVATGTVVRWGRQFLAWEHRNDDRVGTRSSGRAPEVGDPTGLAIGILARRGEPDRAAQLLDDPVVWKAALGRVYDDGGAALARVVRQAGQEAGERGDRVVRLGLATAGAGLAGDVPADWTVNRHTLAAVAPGLGAALSAHVGVAVDALRVGLDGAMHGEQADVLAGLGYVTLDRSAARAVEDALSAWAQVRPESLDAPESSAAATLGAYVAVEQYGQRRSYALDVYEAREMAEIKKAVWTAVTLPLVLVPGPEGVAVGIAAGYLGVALHMDGTWDAGADRGFVFDASDAARAASSDIGVSAAGRDAETAVADRARLAYRRTMAVLGTPTAPASPDADLAAPVRDAVKGVLWSRVTRGHEATELVGSTLDHLFG